MPLEKYHGLVRSFTMVVWSMTRTITKVHDRQASALPKKQTSGSSQRFDDVEMICEDSRLLLLRSLPRFLLGKVGHRRSLLGLVLVFVPIITVDVTTTFDKKQ